LNLRRPEGTRGQSLAEFALVFPFFIIILFGVIEFAFVFNASLSIEFATRDSALAAAEAGNTPGADCSILKVVEAAMGPPTDRNAITEVRIYKSDPNGNPVGPTNIYSRTGAATCPGLPYHMNSGSYPDTGRCNVLAGCLLPNGTKTTTVDTIGVQVTYVYKWKTPLASLLPVSGPGYTMTTNNAMRMEPVL
jgi:Flp pilus assembly protein TadG